MTFDALTLEFLQEKFIIGILFFARVTALLVSAPFFNNTAIPPVVKALLAIFLSMLMTTAFTDAQPPVDLELFNMVVLIFKEALVGLMIGFSSNLVFQAVRLAGGIIDFDMGYQTSLIFNLGVDAPTLVGELKSVVTLMLFLILNGHHFLLESIYASVGIVPLTAFSMSDSTADMMVRLITSMFIVGVKIAAPILVALFVTNLALALLSRVAPQVNIFVLSFQFKILVGLLILFISVPLLVIIIKNALTMFERDIMDLILTLQPV